MYETWFEVPINFVECWNNALAWISFTVGSCTTLFVSIMYKLLIELFGGSGGLQTVLRLCEARSLLWANARPHTLQTYGFSPIFKSQNLSRLLKENKWKSYQCVYGYEWLAYQIWQNFGRINYNRMASLPYVAYEINKWNEVSLTKK